RHELWIATGHDAKAGATDPGHHPLLLEEQPLRDLRSLERALRQEPRSLAEKPEDRVRLSQDRAVVELEHRCLAGRVQHGVLVGQRVAAWRRSASAWSVLPSR